MTRARDIASNGGLVLISSTTIGTAVSSVTLSSVFSATYDNYKIVISGGVCSASTYNAFQLTVGGTASTVSYYSGRPAAEFATSGGGNANTNNSSNFPYAGYGWTNNNNMNMDVLMPFETKRTLTTSVYVADVFGAAMYGLHDVATSYDGFKITRAAGTMTGGTISVYGYKK